MSPLGLVAPRELELDRRPSTSCCARSSAFDALYARPHPPPRHSIFYCQHEVESGTASTGIAGGRGEGGPARRRRSQTRSPFPRRASRLPRRVLAARRVAPARSGATSAGAEASRARRRLARSRLARRLGEARRRWARATHLARGDPLGPPPEHVRPGGQAARGGPGQLKATRSIWTRHLPADVRQVRVARLLRELYRVPRSAVFMEGSSRRASCDARSSLTADARSGALSQRWRTARMRSACSTRRCPGKVASSAKKLARSVRRRASRAPFGRSSSIPSSAAALARAELRRLEKLRDSVERRRSTSAGAAAARDHVDGDLTVAERMRARFSPSRSEGRTLRLVAARGEYRLEAPGHGRVRVATRTKTPSRERPSSSPHSTARGGRVLASRRRPRSAAGRTYSSRIRRPRLRRTPVELGTEPGGIRPTTPVHPGVTIMRLG